MCYAGMLDGYAELRFRPVHHLGHLAACAMKHVASRRLVVTRSRKRTGALFPEAGGSLLADHADVRSRLRSLFDPLGLHLFCPLPYSLPVGFPAGL